MKLAVAGLSALAHEGRLSIFRLLVQAGAPGLAAGEIARRLDMPPSTLSANLTVLGAAGLAESRREGRSIIHSAQYGRMSDLLGFLMEDCCAHSAEVCGPLADVLARAACRPQPKETA